MAEGMAQSRRTGPTLGDVKVPGSALRVGGPQGAIRPELSVTGAMDHLRPSLSPRCHAPCYHAPRGPRNRTRRARADHGVDTDAIPT